MNYIWSKATKGEGAHQYYLYTLPLETRTALGIEAHMTVPLDDIVAGRIGSYPHVSITHDKLNKKKKWNEYAETQHLYVVKVTEAAPSGGTGASRTVYKPQSSSGAGIALKSGIQIFFDKCVEDLKELKALPARSGWWR